MIISRWAGQSACLALSGTLLAMTAMGQDLDEVTFGTSWYAQAEHGGFYQALATGIYEDHGLDVSIEMGGPQVNGMQLLVSGRIDFNMGYPISNINAVAEDLPAVTVAAAMQKDPQALLAHPWVESFEQMQAEDLDIYVATSAHSTYWPWLKAEFGFTDDDIRPYTFSVAPFLNNEDIVQQGYISSEPFAMEQGGVEPSIFLFADYGYPAYATTIETTHAMVSDNPDVVRRFVQASMEGWASYLENPAPGNELIKQDNPEMTDEQIQFGLDKMEEYGLVVGGDAADMGIGVMTDERWQQTYEFMVAAGLVSDDVDLSQAYTLEFLPATAVMP